jgi:hypothetical protein
VADWQSLLDTVPPSAGSALTQHPHPPPLGSQKENGAVHSITHESTPLGATTIPVVQEQNVAAGVTVASNASSPP